MIALVLFAIGMAFCGYAMGWDHGYKTGREDFEDASV